MTTDSKQAQPAIIGDQHLFQELVSRLSDPEQRPSLDQLVAAARPDLRQSAFLFAIARALQQGPGVGDLAKHHPTQLLLLAADAIRAGLLPAETTASMYQQLTDAGEALVTAQLWSRQRPFWWQPLPAMDSLIHTWQQFKTWTALLPKQFQEGIFRENPHYFQIDHLLPSTFTDSLYATLETLYQSGALTMARAGVGASATTGRHRGDEVRYLNGCEADLLAASTTLALLVRWATTDLAQHLVQHLDLPQLSPPQKAMLARYPGPSQGYHAHVDNPGGACDNGRGLTLLLYLNPARQMPNGGRLRLWPSASTPSEISPREVKPSGGSLVGFDSRAWVHQVSPIAEGPPRWALSMWLNDHRPRPIQWQIPQVTATEMMLSMRESPLPSGYLACHHMLPAQVSGKIKSYPIPSGQPRVGFVCTSYRGGQLLKAWCQHHLKQGASHLILIFDHLQEPEEMALANHLKHIYDSSQLTCIDGELLALEGWPNSADFPDRKKLTAIASSSGTSWSVAARQSLNASTVLQMAKTDAFGGAGLDWLVHIDADEFFYLEGDLRAGTSLQEHFALATAQDWRRIRYLNHELLAPWAFGQKPTFKLNPKLAAARLGSRGWQALCRQLNMAQTDERPYFSGYHNGKSAVAVPFATAAAGVHDWYLSENQPGLAPCLAGPSILHFHCRNAELFVTKYLTKGKPPDEYQPFEASPLEQAVMASIEPALATQQVSKDLAIELKTLFYRRTQFSANQVALLDAAGLLNTPALF